MVVVCVGSGVVIFGSEVVVEWDAVDVVDVELNVDVSVDDELDGSVEIDVTKMVVEAWVTGEDVDVPISPEKQKHM